jgi:penicillin-binding protein activator
VVLDYFRNETGQDVDAQLEAMLSETETWLVQSGAVTMVARDPPVAMAQQTNDAAFFRFQARDDDAHLARIGRQLGVRYYVTGKLQSSDETWHGAHRIQYWVFLQILESDTGAIRFQEKAEVTKVME